MKRILLVISILFITWLTQLQAQNAPLTTIGTVRTDQQIIDVPVTVMNFSNIGSGQLKLFYDPLIAMATSVILNPGLNDTIAMDYYTGNPGEISISWFKIVLPGINLPDNTVIFTLRFSKVAIGTTPVTASNVYSHCLYFGEDFRELSQSPFSSFYFDGRIVTYDNAPIVSLPQLIAGSNTSISIPVITSDFTNIGAFSLTFSYDPDVMVFDSYANDSGFPGFTMDASIPGWIFAHGYSASAGISIPDNSPLFTVNFQYNNGNTSLEWLDNGSSCEFKDWPLFGSLNDIPQTNYYMDGGITQAGVFEVNCPSDLLLNNDPGACGKIVEFVATPVGNPDPLITYKTGGVNIASPYFFPVGTTIVEVTAANQYGTLSCTFEVIVNDVEPPIVSPAGQMNVACISEISAPSAPLAIDNCDNEIEGTPEGYTDIPNPLVCQGQRIYTFSYTDSSGNSSTWTYTYSIVYEDFVIPMDDSETIACASELYTPVPPAVFDNCGNQITEITGPEISAVPDCEGEVNYVWNYADCAGNTHSWTFTFFIEYQDFELPENQSEIIACSSELYTPVPPAVFDNCGNQITEITGPEISAVPDCEGEVNYVWNYADCAGNTHSWTFTFFIEYQDFELLENQSEIIACASELYTPVPPAVFDNCGNQITEITGPEISAVPDCEGEVNYVWNYADCAGNTHSWTFTFFIEYQDFELPENQSEIIACSSELYTPVPPAVFNNCGNQITEITGPEISAVPDCEGEVNYVWNYADCAGNTHSWTFTFFIEYQGFELPENQSEIIACASELYTPVPPAVFDNCGNQITEITGPEISAIPDCEGEVNYAWNYSDCAGNTHEWKYVFTILPTTGPELVNPETDCTSLDQSGLAWTLAQANLFDANTLIESVETLYQDNCGGPVSALLTNSIPDENNSNEIWTITYEFTVTDICNHSEICLITYSGGIQPTVPDYIDLPTRTVIAGDDLCFGAKKSIIVQQGLTVTGGSISLIAGESIRLLPGVNVQSGAYLHAFISNNFCENPTPLPKNTETTIRQIVEPAFTANNFFVVFPNPSSGIIMLEISGDAMPYTVEIFKLTGEKIFMQDNIYDQKGQFDLSNFPGGVYIIRVIRGNLTGTEKIIMQ